MRPQRAWKHLYRKHMRATPGKNFQLGRQPGHDVVANQIRQSLLGSERILYAAYMPRLVLHADKQRASGGIGKRDNRAENAVWRRYIPLELQRFPSGCLSSSSSLTTLNPTLKLNE
jgi:hypothetical protein